jgi:hypothetical protein
MKPRPFLASQWFNRVPFGRGIARRPLSGGILLFAGLLTAELPAAAAADAATKPRAHLQSVAQIAAAPASARGLGVTLSRATAVLRQQLGLKRGAGLVADDVATGSKAARAGFLQHDVLVRLDDQILVLPEQLDALLESAEPGDPLACTVLRGGREVVIPLGKPGPVVAAASGGDRRGDQPLRTGGLRPTASSLAIIAPVPRPASSLSGMPQLGEETLVRHDPDFQIRLARGDQTRLTVTDSTGRVVFEGGIDSAADRGRVPVAVRDRVADMETLLEPRAADSEPGLVVTASAVGAPAAPPAARIGHLNVAPVELR